MHYYNFHIGDYASHTRHLSPIEDIAYRRMLDYYYLHEQPIQAEHVARKIGMKEYAEDVLIVLDEFFEKTDEGYINRRADAEIQQYNGFKEAGKRGAAKRWGQGAEKPEDSPPNREGNTPPKQGPMPTITHNPLPNNHKPVIERDSAKRGSITCAREDALPSLPDVVSFFSAAKLPIYQAEQYYAHLSRDGPIPDWKANAMVWAIDNINKHKRTNHAGNTAQQNGDPHAIANWKFVEACEQQHTGTGKINPRK